MAQAFETRETTAAFKHFVGKLLTAGWRFLLATCFAAGLSGCGKQPDASSSTGTISKRPLLVMNALLKRGELERAWEQADGVLENHGDDPITVLKVARLAQDVGKPIVGAELLVKACRLESFKNWKLVQQAMVGLIAVGRLHDGMEMLEEAIEKQPMQHENRRWLYDFYIGTENRKAALAHGHFLVLKRKFDLELLQSLSNTERRIKDSEVLEQMIARNPDDKRPLIGSARHKYDEGEFSDAIDILRSIVSAHSDFLPAQALLGRSLAANGNLDELESWCAAQQDDIESYADYWLAVGDWARSESLTDQAARAYWESTLRDADVLEAWSKLSTSLLPLKVSGQIKEDDEVLAAVQNRASLLSSFNQLKNKFERTGSISRETTVEIVEALEQLGRLWEAEAWAVIATKLPEDDAVDVAAARQSVISKLKKDTPWQVTEQHPEFQLNLSQLPLPTINKIAIAPREVFGNQPEIPPTGIQLINEAADRRLDFFGRTSDTLDQPGIMLYQTLGCGGGTIDFDQDGWSDLYLAAAGGTPPEKDSRPNALMRNQNGTFQDVSMVSGTGDLGFAQGIAVGDLNEDGFADLVVLNYGPNTLLINNGDGTFRDASELLAANGDVWSASAAVADLDLDSISDLVVVNYCDGIEPVTVPCAMQDSDVIRSCSPMKFAAAPDQFFHASETGTLTEKTNDWHANPNVLGRGLGIVAGYLDPAPGMDLFIANDMTNNHFWSVPISDDAFEFSESAMLRGLGANDRALAQGSMGIAVGDFDNDSDIDFYVTNFDDEYNTLHEQRGSGIWQDQTSAAKLTSPTMPLVGFGSEAADLDLDGRLELIVANGHVDMFSRGDEKSMYAHPMQLFQRTEDRSYDSITESMSDEYISSPHVGRALWTIDANKDHRCDLVVTHQTEPVALLMNHSQVKGDWVEMKLVGTDCSRDAIGALVTVTAADRSWTVAQTSGDGYFCSNERILRVGLGDVDEKECEISVTWPDRSVQRFLGVQTNQSWLIVQSQDQLHSLE